MQGLAGRQMSQLANVSGWQRSQLANVIALAEPARAPGLFSTAGAQLDGLSWLGSKCHRLANVLVGKCHRLANVSVGKCLGWQMTAGKCHGGQMTASKSPGGKGSAGKCISTLMEGQGCFKGCNAELYQYYVVFPLHEQKQSLRNTRWV